MVNDGIIISIIFARETLFLLYSDHLSIIFCPHFYDYLCIKHEPVLQLSHCTFMFCLTKTRASPLSSERRFRFDVYTFVHVDQLRSEDADVACSDRRGAAHFASIGYLPCR